MLTKEELNEFQELEEICKKLNWRITRKKKELGNV